MKKHNRLLSLALVLVLTLALTAAVTADNVATSNQLRLGDANGDGIINAADALEVLQFAVGKRTAFSAENWEGTVSPTHVPSDDLPDENACLIDDDPWFSSVSELEDWLRSDKPKDFLLEDAYNSLFGDSSVSYDVPADFRDNPLAQPKSATVDRWGAVSCFYSVQDSDPDKAVQYWFVCAPGSKTVTNTLFKSVKSRVDAGDENYALIRKNGIAYYCRRSNTSFLYDTYLYFISAEKYYIVRYRCFHGEQQMDFEELIDQYRFETVTLPLQ